MAQPVIPPPRHLAGGPFSEKPNPYLGCTTFGCEWGFNGDERHMPSEWDFCPKCGGGLAMILVRPLDQTDGACAPFV